MYVPIISRYTFIFLNFIISWFIIIVNLNMRTLSAIYGRKFFLIFELNELQGFEKRNNKNTSL